MQSENEVRAWFHDNPEILSHFHVMNRRFENFVNEMQDEVITGLRRYAIEHPQKSFENILLNQSKILNINFDFDTSETSSSYTTNNGNKRHRSE
jgi:hypothetical protein